MQANAFQGQNISILSLRKLFPLAPFSELEIGISDLNVEANNFKTVRPIKSIARTKKLRD